MSFFIPSTSSATTVKEVITEDLLSTLLALPLVDVPMETMTASALGKDQRLSSPTQNSYDKKLEMILSKYRKVKLILLFRNE